MLFNLDKNTPCFSIYIRFNSYAIHQNYGTEEGFPYIEFHICLHNKVRSPSDRDNSIDSSSCFSCLYFDGLLPYLQTQY